MSSDLVAVGIDLGGTNLKAGVVNREGMVLLEEVRSTDLDHGPDALVSDMVGFVDDLSGKVGVDRSELAGVGVGSPGPLVPSRGRIIKSANLPGWTDVPLGDLLRGALDLPVVIDNDANVAAFGEYWAGAGHGVDDLVMLTLGTGIGGGVIQEGEIFHGRFENAAEIGHMIVALDGLPCGCRQRGCLERYASASAVARRFMHAVRAGEISSLADAIEAGDEVDCQQVCEAAKSGDALAIRVWDEACNYLALACVNIQHLYNPARIILGGGMSNADAYLLDTVDKHYERMKWCLHDDFPELSLAELGNSAGFIGAAGLVLRQYNMAKYG